MTGGEVVKSTGSAALDALLLGEFIENSCFEPSENGMVVTFNATPNFK